MGPDVYRKESEKIPLHQREPNIYSQDNEPLRPMLKKMLNVEENVSTLKLNKTNYVMVAEDDYHLNPLQLISAPT